MRRNSFISFCIAIILVSVVRADVGYSSCQDISFTANYDGTTQNYVQMLPDGFDANESYDVVIALHGHGSDRWQYATGTYETLRATRDIAASHNMIFISPDYRASTSWMGPAAEADVVQVIQILKQQYNVNDVILTGASMGGASSLTFTAMHSNLIDGVSSVNGLADHMSYENFQDAISQSFGGTKTQAPQEYYNRSAINFPGSFTMPFAVTAGGQDTIVPPQSVLSLYDTVSASNARTIKFYRPQTGHTTNYVDTAVALEYVIRQVKGVDPKTNPITINTSFEFQTLGVGEYTFGGDSVDGWSTVGTDIGVVDTLSAAYVAEYIESSHDGENVAFARQSAMWQYLGTQIQAGTYTLTFQAGSQLSNSTVGTFLAGFATAGNNIAECADIAWADGNSYTSGPGLTPGHWSEVTVEWDVLPGESLIGEELYINFYANNDQWVHFDDVVVTYTPVPEPTTMGLLAVGGLVGLIRRRR